MKVKAGISMEQQKIKEEILRILNDYRVGTLCTMKGDQPFARYMIFRNDECILYTITSRKTEKVRDILNNPKVHILLGFEGGGRPKPYLDIVANATIHDEKELKDRFWHDNFLKYLTGPDDPNYVIIRCSPQLIRLMSHPELDGPYTWSFT
nr:pyridoxamine 5'-phosphate oxidase family protein [uncultured Bacillus sp.]